MPYIKQEDRVNIDAAVTLAVGHISNAGQLNYAISKLIHSYILKKLEYTRLSYDKLNEVIGALECAKLELIRTVVSPYEQNKKAENGSVSILD